MPLWAPGTSLVTSNGYLFSCVCKNVCTYGKGGEKDRVYIK